MQPLREGCGPILSNQPPIPVPGSVGTTVEVVAVALRHVEAVRWERTAALQMSAHIGAVLPTGHVVPGPGPVPARRRNRSRNAAFLSRVRLRIRRRVRPFLPVCMVAREVPVRIVVVLCTGGMMVGTLVGTVAGMLGAMHTAVAAVGNLRSHIGRTTYHSTLPRGTSRPGLLPRVPAHWQMQ